MNRVRVEQPTDELLQKIHMAIEAVASQEQRVIRCPYCKHSAIIVFEDTRGHVQTKCKHCRREVVLNVLSMRRCKPSQMYKI